MFDIRRTFPDFLLHDMNFFFSFASSFASIFLKQLSLFYWHADSKGHIICHLVHLCQTWQPQTSTSAKHISWHPLLSRQLLLKYIKYVT